MKSDKFNTIQREYFSSADQPTILPQETPYVLRHIEQLVRCGNLNNKSKILEVGAGVGRFSRLLTAKQLDITASDISPELIRSLSEYSPEIPAFVGDVNCLPVQHHGLYDVVVGFFMLHHMEDLVSAFTGMRAALKPGGEVIFCEPNAWFFPFYLQILLTPKMRWKVDKGVMNMRQGILEPAFEKSGFKVIERRHYGFFPPQIYNRPWGESLDQKLGKLSLPKRMHAFQIIRAVYEC